MLPGINRIKRKKDFETIFKNAKSFKNNLFISKIVKNGLGLNRVGFVVSQKVSKKATVRNKVKRRLSEILSPKMKEITAGTDVILIALSGIEKKEFFEIKECVEMMLFKTRLISGEQK